MRSLRKKVIHLLPYSNSSPKLLPVKRFILLLLVVILGLLSSLAAAQTSLSYEWAFSQLTTPNSIAYSPDGTKLAVCDNDGVEVMTLASGATIYLPTAATSDVYSLAFSPDGKSLAVGGFAYNVNGTFGALSATGSSGNGVLEVWNVSTGQLTASLATACTAGVNAVAFSSDGKTVAAGGSTGIAGVLELWTVTANTVFVSSLPTAAGTVNAVAFSKDGATLGVGGDTTDSTTGNIDANLELWSVNNHNLAKTLDTGGWGAVYSVAFSSDGQTMAVGGYNNGNSALELWNYSTHSLIGSLNSSAIQAIYSVGFSKDGTKVADGGSGATSGVVEIWSVSTQALLQNLPTSAFLGVYAVAFSPDGSQLTDGGLNTSDVNAASGALETWLVSTGSSVSSTVIPGSYGLNMVTFSPDGTTVADSGFTDNGPNGAMRGVLELRNSSTGKVTSTLATGSTNISAVAYSPDGKTLVDGGTNGSAGVLELWNALTGASIASLATTADEGVTAVAFSPDNKTFADGGFGDVGSLIEIWDAPSQTLTGILPTSASNGVNGLAFSPDQTMIADGGYSSAAGVLEIWNLSTKKIKFALGTSASQGVNSVAFSSDSTMLAAGGSSFDPDNFSSAGVLELWNTTTGMSTTLLLQDGTGIVTSVAFSPDNTVLFAATDIGLQTFSLSTNTFQKLYSVGWLTATGVSPGGSQVAYATKSGELAVVSNPDQSAPVVSSLTLSPAAVIGGVSSTGTVTLKTAAPAGGAIVALTSTGNVASVPASVTVPAGSTTATFTVETTGVNGATSSTIVAGSDPGAQSAVLTINPASLVSLSVNPTSVVGGNPTTGTVTLNGLAGPGGTVVAVQSGGSAAVVANTMIVPAGQTTGTFTINTVGVKTATTVKLGTTLGSVNEYATLTLTPASFGMVTLSPSSVLGGSTSTGTVVLNGQASLGGITVTLASSLASVASVPKSVTVLSGQSQVTFTVKTTGVSVTKLATITGTSGKIKETAVIAVNPPTLKSISLNPTTVSGGATVTGTLTLSGVAPAGLSVKLTSSVTNATLPASVVVPVGKTSATFVVRTTAVAAQKVATIKATLNGVAQTATLTINPPTLQMVALKPVTVVGGISSVGTVTLSGNAPTGGLVVTLSSGSSAAIPPKTVTVPAGRSTVTFTVKTVAVATNTSAVITASQASVSKTATLTITAPTLRALTLSPASVKGGKASTGTVSITSSAPVGGLVISISASGSSAVAPSSVTIPGGKTSVTFSVKTSSVKSKTSATVTATLNGASKVATLTIS